MTDWEKLPSMDFSLFPANMKANLELYEIETVLKLKAPSLSRELEVPDSFSVKFSSKRPIFSTKTPAHYSNKQVRGEQWIGDFTKFLSNRLHLSKVFANRCIRCTAKRAKEKRLRNNEVGLITGHKKEETSRRREIASIP